MNRLLSILVLAAVASAATTNAGPSKFLSPGELAISPDGARLYVACEKSDELLVVNTATSRVLKRIAVGHVPRGVSVSANGKQVYVVNSWNDSVSVIDTQKLAVVATVKAGFEPISAVADKKGATLYVANRLSNDISVIDLQSGNEIKRLQAGRGASYLAISADGSRIYCTHIYPAINAHRAPPESEITVIDTATQRIVDRVPLHNAAGVFHLAISPDGKVGVAALLRPKNLVPLAHVEHGWAITNSLAIFGDGFEVGLSLPIDELDRYFALPFGVAITPDRTKVFVSAAGSNTVTAIRFPPSHLRSTYCVRNWWRQERRNERPPARRRMRLRFHFSRGAANDCTSQVSCPAIHRDARLPASGVAAGRRAIPARSYGFREARRSCQTSRAWIFCDRRCKRCI